MRVGECRGWVGMPADVGGEDSEVRGVGGTVIPTRRYFICVPYFPSARVCVSDSVRVSARQCASDCVCRCISVRIYASLCVCPSAWVSECV